MQSCTECIYGFIVIFLKNVTSKQLVDKDKPPSGKTKKQTLSVKTISINYSLTFFLDDRSSSNGLTNGQFGFWIRFHYRAPTK